MDEVLFSYFLKKEILWRHFFQINLELNRWSIPSVHMISDALSHGIRGGLLDMPFQRGNGKTKMTCLKLQFID